MTTALLFAASAILLVAASELFTNAVEWAGYRLGLGSGATGSLLAALGTSLPETAVPVVALATGAHAADSVAIGAVLGAPFLLLTVGMLVTGTAVTLRRGATLLSVDRHQARRDLGTFLAAFPLALIAILLPRAARIGVGIVLLAIYGTYVTVTVRSGEPVKELPEPLHIVRWRSGRPRPAWIALQLLVSVVMLVIASQLFVDALGNVAAALRIPVLLLALVVVPLATELPETMNSVLWVRSGDDTLAVGNVAGSATFQACVLAFIGVAFTTWRPGGAGIISGILTIATALLLLGLLRHGRTPGRLLMLAGLPWVGYVVAQVVSGGRLGG